MTAHDNPLGLDGFEFVEFTSPDPEALAGLFASLGFTHLGNHRAKAIRHYAQGDINFLLNMEPAAMPREFREAHGPSASAMAFRVADAEKALALAVERGATAAEGELGPAGDRGDRRLLPLSGRPLRRARRSTTAISSRSPAQARRQRRRPAHARPPHPQCESRPDGPLGAILRDGSSTSARSAISTSRASRPACSPGR